MNKHPRLKLSLGVAIAVAFCSCQIATHEAHNGNKWEKDMTATVGGTTHTTGADGWSNTTDHNASFDVAMKTGGTVLTAYIGVLYQRAVELTNQLHDANLTKVQIATIKADLRKTLAQIDAGTKQLALNLGVTSKG